MTEREIKYLIADRIREVGNVSEVGRKAGCNRNNIYNFLNGHKFRYDLFLRVLDALDLEVIVRRKADGQQGNS